MADKRCDNGHFIDESWDLCPYCPQDNSEPEVPVVRPRAAEAAPPPRPVTASRPHPVPAPAPAPEPIAAPSPFSDPAPAPAAAAALSHDSGPVPAERTVAASKLDVPKRYVVGWLVGLNGSSRGEAYPVRMGRNVLGRDRRSDIVVNDDQASSHHADLVFRPDERRFILMDHNSTNGTYVNEAEIEPRRDLTGKDVIRIGSHRYLFMPLCHDGFYWDDEGLLK